MTASQSEAAEKWIEPQPKRVQMSERNPSDKCQAWPNHSMFDRVQHCRVNLLLHGFLTQGESDKVQRRIDKWLAKSAAVTPAPGENE